MTISSWIQVAILCLAGVFISFHDLRFHRIRNSSLIKFVFWKIAFKILNWVCFNSPADFSEIIYALLVTFSIFLLLYFLSKGSLGMGDVKLAPLLAFLVEIENVENFILWFGHIWFWGGLHALGQLVATRKWRQNIAFAPALFLGSMSFVAIRMWGSLPQ